MRFDNMAELSDITDYLTKIKRTINYPDLDLFGNSLVEKSRVDDLWCCFLATLPKSYKEKMSSGVEYRTYPSMGALNQLSEQLKKKFMLMPKYYFIDRKIAVNNIEFIESKILNDINKLGAA